MDSTATVIIGAALLFYTIGVWGERIQGRLKWWQLVFFGLGLICDTWGTGLMFEFVGGMTYDVHGISGLIAILLMFVHAIWALVVLLKKDENAIQNFHKFSVAVWAIWLIPYFSPMFFSMAG
ncbi:MAG: TIGR03987 family protein [Chloroflexi bacterium]|nr:TIGR03987 family protein [Chloroflexota bacterium]